MLGICYRTLERWYNSGYIDRIRIGGRIYFPKKELLRVARLSQHVISTLIGRTSLSRTSICKELGILKKCG